MRTSLSWSWQLNSHSLPLLHPSSPHGKVAQEPKTDCWTQGEVGQGQSQGSCCGTTLLPSPCCHECRCDGQSLRSHPISITRKRPIKETIMQSPHTQHSGATVSMLAMACLRTSVLYEKNSSICFSPVTCSPKHSHYNISKE